jgi:hypothetical protein
MSKWICVKERLPESDDGITQLWLTKDYIPDFVLGYAVIANYDGGSLDHATHICDYNEPDNLKPIEIFSHWMSLNPLPERK